MAVLPLSAFGVFVRAGDGVLFAVELCGDGGGGTLAVLVVLGSLDWVVAVELTTLGILAEVDWGCTKRVD